MMKIFLLISLAILFLCPVMINAGEPENLKIAVAANVKSAQASVSNMAAKCPYYLIFNNPVIPQCLLTQLGIGSQSLCSLCPLWLKRIKDNLA